MIENELPKSDIKTSLIEEKICELTYLTEMMSGKKNLIKGIMDAFLKQIPEELLHINNAIIKKDFTTIKNFAHTMKSSVSIMGITILSPILKEMEDLGVMATDIDKIKELNQKLNLICKQAIEEIEKEKHNYG
jgi:HPt (histidine-containing phosphotransfer) domain-containing protein